MSKLILVFLISTFLVACATPVVRKPKFPEPPELLMRPVPDLLKIEPKPST